MQEASVCPGADARARLASPRRPALPAREAAPSSCRAGRARARNPRTSASSPPAGGAAKDGVRRDEVHDLRRTLLRREPFEQRVRMRGEAHGQRPDLPLLAVRRRRRRCRGRPSVRRSRPRGRRARRDQRTSRRGAGCSRRRGRASGQSCRSLPDRLEQREPGGDADVQRVDVAPRGGSRSPRHSTADERPDPLPLGAEDEDDTALQICLQSVVSASAAKPYTQSSGPLTSFR